MRQLTYAATVLTVSLLSGCGESRPSDAESAAGAPPVFPDYINVTVPPNIAPLNFEVPGGEKVWVEIYGEDGGAPLLTTGGDYADFPEDKWHKILRESAGKDLKVRVYAREDGKWRCYDSFPIHVSPTPLPDYGLTYRRIAPGYETYSKMGLYERELTSFRERPLIENSVTETNSCVNCHTSNRGDFRQSTYHMRGKLGGTYLRGGAGGEAGEWYEVVSDSLVSGPVYPYWHPEGGYCAFSTNTTSQGFINHPAHPVEVYDGKSDIIILDIINEKVISSPLLRRDGVNENTPAFSPDGKWLYFIEAPEVAFPAHYKDIRYNICRIGFDSERGEFGEKIDTVYNAAAIGKSATWPRPSYDGKHLLFTTTDYGYFSIWHPEARQWLMDLASGELRPIGETPAGSNGSYHNWSSDSRWIVYTSRGPLAGDEGDNRYTRLYIAHIDEEGRIGKPFLLPQRDPGRYYRETLHSFNTPDFTQEKTDYDVRGSLEKLKRGKRKIYY